MELKSHQQKAKKPAAFPTDNLNNNFHDDDDDNFNGNLCLGDTNFGDQEVLSGKLYVNNQSGNVEGVTITHHGKTSTPVKWCGCTRKSKTANEENIVWFANEEFWCTEEQAEKIKKLIKSMRGDCEQEQEQEQEPR